MLLASCGVALSALIALIVWVAADRWWHYLIIAVGWIPFFPIVATRLTGDVSRYLPPGAFSEGARGKDEIVIASAYATIAISIAIAAVIFWLLRIVLRGRLRY